MPIAKLTPITIGPFEFSAPLWRYTGEKASWYFVSLPSDTAEDIRACTEGGRRGWGSIPVSATIGSSSWSTSLFPQKQGSTYLLPVKAAIRKQEALEVDKLAQVVLSIKLA